MSSPMLHGRVGRTPALLAATVLAMIAALFLGLAAEADAKKKEPKGPKIGVMTRNIYLGADLRPALSATDVNEAVDLAGEIANQVDRTNFPLRAQALAAEILDKRPDLVGMQEVSLFRTAPVNVGAVVNPTATEVEYDFLELLMAELNKSGLNYEVVIVKDEFDIEFPVNDDTSDGVSGLAGADRNGRFTQRDVILRRVDSKVQVSNPTTGTYDVLATFTLGGVVPITVARGWTAVDATLKGTKPFRFVNTHLEAFDSEPTQTGSDGNSYTKGNIRAAQATQLVSPTGAAGGSGPVILLGDMNSDAKTVEDNGDRNAFRALLAGGFTTRENSLKKLPISCCLTDPNLVGGSVADFDHQVDHVMVNSKKIGLKNASLTPVGLVNGLWPSDHRGVFSKLVMPAKK